MTPTEYLTKNGNKINGKALRKPDLNLVAKLEAMGLTVIDNAISVYTTNPVSGYSDMVDPFLSALINWVYDTYSTYGEWGTMSYNGTKVAIGTFDRVRYLILSLDHNVHSNFID